MRLVDIKRYECNIVARNMYSIRILLNFSIGLFARLHKNILANFVKLHTVWIKRDQLDVTCFIISLFTAQHVSDVNTSILSLHTDTTPPQPYHNITPTHIELEQYNPRNNASDKSQAPEDGCINIRNMLSSK